MVEWETFFLKLESDIKFGRINSVQTSLKAVPQSEIPSSFQVQYCNLAWRAGVPLLGIKLLNSSIYKKSKLQADATDREILEYSSCLMRLGATKESRNLLNHVDTRLYPKALLYSAFNLIAEWRYEESVNYLENYYHKFNPETYEASVAGVNLISAYVVSEQFTKAEELLIKIKGICETKNYFKLLLNCVELSCQLAVSQSEFDNALKISEAGANLIKENASVESLFFKKWNAIAYSQKTKSTSAYNELVAVQSLAKKMEHYETVRDLDLYICQARPDENTIHRLYFGTPYLSYRKKICKTLNVLFSEKKEGYIVDQKRIDELNLLDGTYNNRKCFKRNSDRLQATLSHLAKDRYRPMRVAQLCQDVFSNEVFDPVHSINKLHQLTFRIRKFFDENQVPAVLTCLKSQYMLQTKPGLALKISADLTHEASYRLELLKNKFGSENEFTSNQVQQFFNCSLRTAQRLIQESLNSKKIINYNFGRQKLYRFAA